MSMPLMGTRGYRRHQETQIIETMRWDLNVGSKVSRLWALEDCGVDGGRRGLGFPRALNFQLGLRLVDLSLLMLMLMLLMSVSKL